MAAIIKHQRLGGLNSRNLTYKIKVSAELVSSKASLFVL